MLAAGFSAVRPFGARLLSDWNLQLLFGPLDQGVECEKEQVRLLQPLRPLLIALLLRFEVSFLRACHGRRTEPARLKLTLVLTPPMAQRVAVVNVQVRPDLAGILPTDKEAEGGGFLPLLAVREALQQVADGVVQADSLLGGVYS